MDLLDKILRLFGTNRVRLRWRLSNMREGMRRSARSAANRSKSLTYEHQLCPECGHPASKEDKLCSRCGARLRGAALGKAGKLLGWLIPDGFPVVTGGILAACAALYFVTVKGTHAMMGDEAGESFTPNTIVLVRYGATLPWIMVEAGQWWRAITAIFLHGSVLHIAMNGIGLWVAGNALEERFGRARMLFAFVLTGIGGNVLAAMVRARGVEFNVPGVGASGAVLGLMGLLIGHAIRFRGRAARELKERFVPWVLYSLIMGFAMSGVDNLAHLGGLGTGVLLGFVLADRDTKQRVPDWAWNTVAVMVLAAVVLSFVMAAQFDVDAMLRG